MRLLLFMIWLISTGLAFANEGGGEGGAQYVEVGPKLIVNLANPKQLMAVSPQLMVEGEAMEAVKKNMSAIKNALIMNYSGRTAESLATAEQREALRKETFEIVKEILEKYGSSEGFSDVFFSDFRIN